MIVGWSCEEIAVYGIGSYDEDEDMSHEVLAKSGRQMTDYNPNQTSQVHNRNEKRIESEYIYLSYQLHGITFYTSLENSSRKVPIPGRTVVLYQVQTVVKPEGLGVSRAR